MRPALPTLLTLPSLLLLASVAALGAACSSSDKTSTPTGSKEGGSTTSAWRAVVGASGVIAQTFDDHSWDVRTAIAGRDLFSVTCAGNLRGWAAGARGLVVHTEDGGQTWLTQDSHLAQDLRAIRVAEDGALGLIAGDGGALAVTADGATWRPVSATRASLHGAYVASDTGLLVAVGDGATVVRSTDRGATWTASTLAGAGSLRGVAGDPGAHLVLAVDDAGAIWASTDGAVTFAREATAQAALDAVSLSDDATRALVAGAHGTVLERDARGAWTPLATGLTADLHAALITDDGHEYVAGAQGALSARTTAAWAPVAVQTTATFYALDDL